MPSTPTLVKAGFRILACPHESDIVHWYWLGKSVLYARHVDAFTGRYIDFTSEWLAVCGDCVGDVVSRIGRDYVLDEDVRPVFAS